MNLEEQQKEVNSLIRRANIFAFLWIAGFGSLRAVGHARHALKLIRESNGQLYGENSAKGALQWGILGMVIYFPLIIIGIIVSSINH